MIFKDQLNETIQLSGIPERVVSLVPSQTELLFSLGLGDRVVGITKFCNHPDVWYRSKTRVGGTKDAKKELIAQLNPDIIIGNKEENEKSNIEELRNIAPVWMSDIATLDDAFDMIAKLGDILGVSEKAVELIHTLKIEFSELKKVVEKSRVKNQKVLYFIWRKPFLVAGKNTFIDEMLKLCGFDNLCHQARYPEWSLDDKGVAPDLIFLSSEPYPFKEKHVEELEAIYPTARIRLVDGEMFSWYGSRLLKAPNYFKSLIQG
jgi:ABC-type Fe3+-hydroxamate transport system substrate-binding protein